MSAKTSPSTSAAPCRAIWTEAEIAEARDFWLRNTPEVQKIIREIEGFHTFHHDDLVDALARGLVPLPPPGKCSEGVAK